MRVGSAATRLVVVLLGAWVGFLGSVAHRTTGEVGPVTVPWGLLLALVTVVAVARACDQRVPVGAAWFGLGWTLILVGQQLQTSGSYLVAGDALGWTYLGGGLGACAAVVVLAPRSGR